VDPRCLSRYADRCSGRRHYRLDACILLQLIHIYIIAVSFDNHLSIVWCDQQTQQKKKRKERSLALRAVCSELLRVYSCHVSHNCSYIHSSAHCTGGVVASQLHHARHALRTYGSGLVGNCLFGQPPFKCGHDFTYVIKTRLQRKFVFDRSTLCHHVLL
jgi:hypothetical protein